MRHLLTLFDLTSPELKTILAIAKDLKAKYQQGLREPLLPGRVMGLLFEKPSLRTRVSFEAAMTHLGGSSLFLGKDVGWGQRESVEDFSRVLSQYLDVIVCRAFDHQRVEELAHYAECSVINGLTDWCHPCQAVADVFTLSEHIGSLTGKTLAYVGDGNNVARSLAVACAHLGIRFTCASPAGYELDQPFLDRLRKTFPKAEAIQTNDPQEAVAGAVGVYTDVWASMGQEAEAAQRAAVFADYQVNAPLMKLADQDACFLHCLPAHRGEEVSAEVIDGPQSLIVQQAGNRMHAQKGILAWLLAAKG